MVLDEVPEYRKQQARIILQAKFGAKMFALGGNKLLPVYSVDPYEIG